MRMWMVNPRKMCRKHLLGEHVELHMLVGTLQRRKRVDGFVANGLIEPLAIRERHGALVKEMERRGYRRQSPLPFHLAALRRYGVAVRAARVSVKRSRAPIFASGARSAESRDSQGRRAVRRR